jgi:hypothetical protein
VHPKLSVDLREVAGRPEFHQRPDRPRREQQFVQTLVVAILAKRLPHPNGGGLLQIPMNRRLADRATAGNLLLPET